MDKQFEANKKLFEQARKEKVKIRKEIKDKVRNISESPSAKTLENILTFKENSMTLSPRQREVCNFIDSIFNDPKIYPRNAGMVESPVKIRFDGRVNKALETIVLDYVLRDLWAKDPLPEHKFNTVVGYLREIQTIGHLKAEYL